MDKLELLRYLVKSTEKEGTALFAQLLKPLNITPNQSEVLLVLSQYEPLSLKEIGELLICERKSPSRLVQKLVDKGFIYKSQSLEDNRKSVLYLTKDGKKIIPEIRQAEKGFHTVILSAINESDTAIEELTSFLAKFIENTDSNERIKMRTKD